MFLVYTTIYIFHKQLRFWVQSEFAKYLTPKFMEAFLTHNLPLYL